MIIVIIEISNNNNNGNDNDDNNRKFIGVLLHSCIYNKVCCPSLYRASSSGKKLLSSKEHLYPKHICSEYQLFMNTKT